MHQNRKKRGNVYVMVRVGCNDELAEPPTGAIDLVGSFNNQPRGTFALSRLSDRTSRPDFLHSWSFFEKFLFEVYFPNTCCLAGNQTAMKEGDSQFGQHLECNNDTFQPHVVTLRNSGENLPTPVAVQSKLKFPSTQLGLIPVPGVRGCMICGGTAIVSLGFHGYRLNEWKRAV
ncbi:hypothetical protein V6N12_013956 [Hibiscus sabdariffa]|uniref:Uncharacterized protein n=1 Tax=Hibiscus sabdariffa TaxID=183260 RepID=A0ABR2B2Q4_9ROSI